MRNRWATLTGLACTLVLAAGCGGDDESEPAAQPQAGSPEAQLAEAAAQEGTVTWYAAFPPEAIEATVEAFEERYPDVNVESLRLTSGQVSTRYAEERSSGAQTADLVSLSNSTFFEEAKQKNWFETQLDLPEGEQWPEEFYGEGKATVGILPLLIGYNSDKVAEGDVPQGWQDLVDPKWRGQLIYGDPRTVPGYLALAELWRQEYGEDFLTQFAAQDYKLTESIVPGSQQLAAGGASLIVPGANTVFGPLVEEGAPIDLTAASPTTGVEFVTAVSTETASPNAAKLLMNFLLTKEGQAVLNGGGGTSVLGDVGGDTVPLPEGYMAVDPLLEDARGREDELLRLLGVEG